MITVSLIQNEINILLLMYSHLFDYFITLRLP